MEQFGAGVEPGEQGSVEWLMSRCGHVTASRFKDVIDKLKSGKPGAARQKYLMEVVIERITNRPAQHYESAAMQHGTEYEPHARMAYEQSTGAMVAQTGFVHHTGIQWVGGSPDGLIGDDGTIEIKCPFNAANHIEAWLNGMPVEHMAQCQGIMWIAGRQWLDFVSYSLDMPEHLMLYVERIHRDQAYIDAMEAEIIVFLAEVDAMVAKLQAIGAK